MGEEARGATIEDLAERAGVAVRTIRFYIAEGLLPGPGGRGKAAAYGEEHLLRLRLIRRLAEQRVPLADVRVRLARLSLDEVRALLAEEDRRAAALHAAEGAPSPKEYVSALLGRARAARQPAPLPAAEQMPSAAPAPAGPAPFATAALAESDRPAKRVSAWRRVELAPGIELHIRADSEDRHRGLVERLLAFAEAAG